MIKDNLTYLAVLIPFIAVIIGMLILKNGFITLGLYHGGMIVTILVLGREKISLIFKGFSLKYILMFGVLIIAAFFATYLMWPLLRNRVILLEFCTNFGLLPSFYIPFALYFIFVNSIIEELFWRGVLESTHLVWIEDFGFALYHIPVLAFLFKPVWLIPIALSILIMSVLWKIMKKRTGGFLSVFITHILADFMIIVVAGAEIFGM